MNINLYKFKYNISIMNYNTLSSSDYISWDLVRNNLTKQWNWNELSKNSIVDFNIIQENEFLKWDWTSISENPNITFDIIVNNLNCKWDYNVLKRILSKEQYNNLTKLRIKYIFENYEEN